MSSTDDAPSSMKPPEPGGGRAGGDAGRQRDRRSGPAGVDALVAITFLAVPLTLSPGLWSSFTVKWYVLEALALAWFFAELWWCRSRGWPGFVVHRRLIVLPLAALALWSCLRDGVSWGIPVLLDRVCFVLVSLSAFWYFRRNRGRTGVVVLGTGGAVSLVVVVGLAQVLGGSSSSVLPGGAGPSSFFANVNMAAQYLGLATIVLLAESPATRLLHGRQALAAASFVYLYFLACRSVFLGLGGALAALAAARWLPVGRLARLLGTAVAGGLLVLLLASHLGDGTAPPGPLDPEVRARKAVSTEWRLAVWGATLGLIRDHPFGVGAGSFGDAFIPYQLGLSMIPGEFVLFRTPHNEALRVLAEDGIVVGALALVLLVSLVRRVGSSRLDGGGRPGQGALVVAGFVFLAIEAFLQFPLGTAAGALFAATLLGLALASLESPTAGGGGEDGASVARWRACGTLLAALALVGLGRAATSELLFVSHPNEVTSLERACRLNPRNLEACVTSAWLRARDGDSDEARNALFDVLRRSPYYHPAIRLLGEEAAARGDRRQACLYLWIYDQLFRGRSPIHGRISPLCGDGRPAGLPDDFAMPHYERLPLPGSGTRPSWRRSGRSSPR